MISIPFLAICNALAATYIAGATASRPHMHEAWTKSPLVDTANKQQMNSLHAVRKAIVANGCTANVCFALDGSSLLSKADYNMQVQFVELVVSLLTTDQPHAHGLCAVQYHYGATTLCPLTWDVLHFRRNLRTDMRFGGGNNVAAGIHHTGEMMASQAGRNHHSNKMVVLGSAFETDGLPPKWSARSFLRKGGSICAIAIGPADLDGLRDITGAQGRVLQVAQFSRLWKLAAKVAQNLCSLDAVRHSWRVALYSLRYIRNLPPHPQSRSNGWMDGWGGPPFCNGSEYCLTELWHTSFFWCWSLLLCRAFIFQGILENHSFVDSDQFLDGEFSMNLTL